MTEWETEPEAGSAVHEFVEALAANLAAVLANARSQVGDECSTSDGKTRLVVALSGGPDSTAVLIALNMVAERLKLSLKAVHLNHQLRGKESDDDETFCRRLSDRLHVELECLAAGDRWSGSSPSENDLRHYRYRLLSISAREFGTSFVVVAHTLDDQAETMLFRLCRGTSLTGLVGMQPLKRLDNGIILLRPALDVTKNECLRFLANLAVSARDDSSNADTKFSRNFIRHELIPLMESRFPGFRQRLERFRRIAGEESQFIEGIAQQELQRLESRDPQGCTTTWSRQQVMDIHPAIRRRIVASAMAMRGVECTYERVQNILEIFAKGHETGISLDTDWDVRIDQKGNIIWLDKKAPGARNVSAVRVRVPGITVMPALGRAMRVEVMDTQMAAAGNFPAANALEAVVDLSNVERPLFLRQRREGDFIQPFGMQERVKLKKYLHTHKLDEGERQQLAGVLLAHADEILWVPGIGLSERLRVRTLPSHRLSWIDLAPDVTSV